MPLLYPKESYIIRGIAFDIYKQFRNNHKERVYHNAYYLGLTYKGLKIVNDIIFIEIKAKPRLTQNDIKQFWYYLKGSNYKLGFLINFGSPNGVQIFRRVYETARK